LIQILQRSLHLDSTAPVTHQILPAQHDDPDN
jgi:hypothetical protein